MDGLCQTYRELNSTRELSLLFEELKDQHTMGAIAYELIKQYAEHPHATIQTLIQLTKKRLYEHTL